MTEIVKKGLGGKDNRKGCSLKLYVPCIKHDYKFNVMCTL